MLFLISLVIAVCFVKFCGSSLRTKPAPYYIAAAVLSVGSVLITQLHWSAQSELLKVWVIPLFTKGVLATACWAIVMWTGALPNRSKLLKTFMPVRGQLSIFAAILTLGHAVGYGLSYIPRWLKSSSDLLNLIYVIVLMVIMLPLAVLSVRKIRSKMKPKTWKKWQRLAYVFYVFIPLHVFGVNLVRARRGMASGVSWFSPQNYWLSLMIYTIVFGSWAVFRLRKAYVNAKKPEKHLIINSISVAVCAAFAVFVGFMARAERNDEPIRTINETSQAVTEIVSETTTTTATEETGTETTVTTTTETDSTNTDTTDLTTNTDETDNTDETTETTVAAAQDEAAQPGEEAPVEQAGQPAEVPQQTEAQPVTTAAPATTAPPQPSIYRDGEYVDQVGTEFGKITVHVTIQNDTITNIWAESEEEDPWYMEQVERFVIPNILNTQRSQVDAASGATVSSDGVMQAVEKALAQARI